MATYHTLGSIRIPSGCIWSDEFDWTPVESAQEYAINGALIVDVAERKAGRPITLEATDDAGWKGMTRQVLTDLYELVSTPGVQLALTLADGRSFTVTPRVGEEPLTARPVARPEKPPADWPYIITLRLTEV